MAKVQLHGTLHVTIYEAHQLFTVLDKFLDGIKEFLGDNEAGKLYVTIGIEGARVGRTRLIEDKDSNPKWDEQIRVYCAHVDSHVVFTLNQDEPIEPTILGRAYLPVTDILNGEELDTWLDILDEDHKPIHHNSKIHVKVQFFDVTTETPEFSGVPFTFFPERNQCRVTLYQDSHVPDNFLPEIPLAGGKYYEPHRCWEDIFDAINEAKHIIYITGWSVYTKITLVRDMNRPKQGGDMTLGELLKKKAQQGVIVLMLVWEDVTGEMETHDDDTAKYFEGSQVHCLLCHRSPGEGRNVIEKIGVTLVFTHHQKTLVVDSAMPNGSFDKRRIVSFVGGIDLCDGRYDTQLHSLFMTLNSSHHEDFHQPNFEGSSIKKGGPREPWHDIHSRLEGLVALDVLCNFEQRWRKQGVKDDLLLDIQKMGGIFIPESQITSPDDQETWNVQIFRSIDGGAAFGFPESPEEVAKQGLVSGKDIVIERSIQDAYIHAIRRAKRFIYIENQYFIGSSFNWKKATDMNPADIGAVHLIPKELSLKIVSKIEKGERFAVYVVVPMWPEGSPNSGPGQAMLDWQRRTMEMMYIDIIQTLRTKGIKANPKEYLSFFCLGNREVKRSGEYEPTEKPEPDSDYSRAQANRRFMIYVHSKMMIVDDEYIIIGSANINQRSMDGARDTEIAMGAYQPYHISHGQNPARGQIHGFRMSLWYEHMGMLDDVFLNPESEECVKKVNQIGNKYWDMYTCDKTLEDDLPGHLLSYPIGVNEDGEVVELHGFEHFPDTKARTLGTQSDLWPSIVTT